MGGRTRPMLACVAITTWRSEGRGEAASTGWVETEGEVAPTVMVKNGQKSTF